MSWKDRAETVTTESTVSDWKSRSTTDTPTEDSTSVQGFFKNYKKPEGILQKADVAAAKIGNFALNVANAPFEFAGEALAAPIEQRQAIKPTVFGGEGAINIISEVNKLLRAGIGATSSIPGAVAGTGENPLDAARSAYNAPRGAMGPIEDTAMAMLLGKGFPKVANAPVEATIQGASKLLQGAGKVTEATRKAAGWVGKKAIRVGTGVSEEAQMALKNRPNEIAAALERGPSEIAKEIKSAHDVLSDKIAAIEKEKIDPILHSSPALMDGATPKETLMGVIKKARKDIGMTVGPSETFAKQALDNIKQNFNPLHNTVSEVQLRDIVQKLADAAYVGKSRNLKVTKLKEIQHELNAILKTNKDYAVAMDEEAPLMRLKTDLEDNWGLEPSVGKGLKATDATTAKLDKVFGKNKELTTQQTLKDLSDVTGVDYLKMVKDNKLANEFKAGARPNGFMRGGAGAAMGFLAENLIPGLPRGTTTALGTGVGTVANYYGGPMAKSIIEMLGKTGTATGNVLSAINPVSKVAPYQAIIREMLRRNPSLIPALSAASSDNR